MFLLNMLKSSPSEKSQSVMQKEQEPRKEEVVGLEESFYDTYIHNVTTAGLYPEAPPQLSTLPPPSWLFCNNNWPYRYIDPFEKLMLKHQQAFLGLKLLSTVPYVLVKQTTPCEKGMDNVDNYMDFTYEICTPTGTSVFSKTEAMNCLQEFVSCGFFSNSRLPFSAKVVDSWASHVFSITRNEEKRACNFRGGFIFRWLLPDKTEFPITFGNGEHIGSVFRKGYMRLRPIFYITNRNREVIIEAVGQFGLHKKVMPTPSHNPKTWIRSHFSFRFQRVSTNPTKNPQVLGSFSKFRRMLRDYERRDRNKYMYKLQYDVKMDVGTKLLLLAASFVIDFEFWRGS